jgi:ubiquinone biosynthesis protein
MNLPRTVRSIRRVQTIARVLTRHGFGHLVPRLRLDRYVPMPRRWRRPLPAEVSPEAGLGPRLVRVFEELGPTFIKFGQVMSTRPDVFPPDIIRALSSLQDHVPPFDSAEARRIIEADLGTTIQESFVSFENEPFASGSIAQVHIARTRSLGSLPSQPVVVKVKRPQIEDMVRLDMTILHWIAQLADRWIPEAQVYRPKTIIEEFERSITLEMDFINEASTITRFGEVFANDPDFDFHIPTVHWDLTGPNVLTLQQLHGISAQVLMDQRDPSYDLRQIARKLALSFIHQFFEVGLFHADPHPGNLLIEPPSSISLVDFGLTGRIDDEMLGRLVIGLLGAIKKETGLIVEVLADMDALGERTDRHRLRQDFAQLVEKYFGLPLYRFELQKLYFEITDLVRRNDVTLPREFILFGKAFVGVGGICLQLDPNLDLAALLEPNLKKILARRFAPSHLARSAAMSGWHMLNILKSGPGMLRDISRKLAQGRWQLNIHHQNLDDFAHEIDRSSNRLSYAIVTAAIIVASSLILTRPDASIFGLSFTFIGLAGYFFAAVLGVGLVVAILRSGKLS